VRYWIPTTRKQVEAFFDLYRRNADGSPNYRAFRRRIVPQHGQYHALPNWCGMYVGIERDGYTHT
jgi:hypothetical protein